MAIDTIARGLASSLVGADGKIATDKMPTLNGTGSLTGFFPVGKLTDPALVEGKTAEEILLMMLFGVVNPVLTDPTLSMSLSAENAIPIIGRPSRIQGSLIFDRGSIEPAYETSGYRAGEPSKFTINDVVINSNQNIQDFDITINPTTTEINLIYSVNYGEGEQPTNSIGQPYGAPLEAGTIADSLTITAAYALYDQYGIDVSFDWFEDEDGQGYISTFATEGSGTKQSFSLSENVTVVGVKAFDTMTQKWTWLGGTTAANSLTHFDKKLVSGASFGETENQVVYVHNQPASGERELRIYVI